MAQRAETVLHRWFEEVWNQKRESAIDELMAEDAMVHGIVGPDGKEIRGAAAFKPFFHHFCAAFPDIRITIEDALVDGDKVAVRCAVTATHTGPGLTAAPTNKAANIHRHVHRARQGWQDRGRLEQLRFPVDVSAARHDS